MDSDTIRRLRSGDTMALKSMYQEFGSRLFKTAIFLADSREEVEDMVQETFVRAFSGIHRFKGQSSPYTWLYRILLNVSYDLKRKKYVHKKFLNRFNFEDKIDPMEDLVREMDRNTMEESLKRALKCQQLKIRQIIVLRFYEDLKLSEIAEILNVTIGTVKSRLHHALKKIKKSVGNFEQFGETSN